MVAEVRVNVCTSETVYRFIEEPEDSSFVNLNQLQRGDREKRPSDKSEYFEEMSAQCGQQIC